MTILTWTDNRVERLKNLWEAGLSASQIATELGNVTRNAVIGKVCRLGLSGRTKSPSSAAPRQRKVRPAQHMMRVSRPAARGNIALAAAFECGTKPVGTEKILETIPTRRLLPTTGFVSSREKRLRGIEEAYEPASSAEEEFLNRHFRGMYG